MEWKANRLAGGLLKGCKERGEWAELYFMMLVVGFGMKVLRLFGDSGRYDVGVENGAQVLRVQVKSTIYTRREGGYSLNVNAVSYTHLGVHSVFCFRKLGLKPFCSKRCVFLKRSLNSAAVLCI